MKSDPSLNLIESIRSSQRGKDYFSGIQRQVQRDVGDRLGWVQKCDHYTKRRYCMEFRDPEYPWPGSSSIVMPLIDKKIDELKPQYVSLVTSSNPPVTAIGIGSDSERKAGNVELWFEWLIKFGSPQFIEQTILAVDDLEEKGRGILKSYWIYETRQSAEILDRARLPERLRNLIVTPKDNADALHALTGGRVPLINLGEFDLVLPKIKEIIKKEFDLDPEEPRDKDAFNAIIQWMRKGTKDKLRIEKRDTVTNLPGVVAVEPNNLILPSNATSNIEDAERITEEMWFTATQIRQKALDGDWNEEAVKLLLKGEAASKDSRKVSMGSADDSYREGVSGIQGGSYNIKATCCWYSATENGPLKKAICLWTPASVEIPLKFVEYVRPSAKWPYHSATFEHNKNRWYSPRGIPEKIDDIDFEVTKQHRYKLNRSEIATAPTLIYRPGAGINPATWRWIPGQMMPAANPALDVREMQFSQLDIVFEREEQNLLTWVEQFLGGTDFGLSTPMASMSEPRTATEIGAIGDRARQSLSLRGLLFQHMMMKPVYREMFDLWHVHGDDAVWAYTTASDPIRLTKEELQGQFVFQPTGVIGEQDRAVEEQKALMRIKILSELQPIIGPRYELDLGEAVEDWLQKADLRYSKRVLRRRTDEEMADVIKKQQEQQQLAMLMQQQQIMASRKPAGGGGGGGAKAPAPDFALQGNGAP